MNAKEPKTFPYGTINPLTWDYMKSFLPPPVSAYVVRKSIYTGTDDDEVVEKWRGLRR
jgi:hypothetical protein